MKGTEDDRSDDTQTTSVPGSFNAPSSDDERVIEDADADTDGAAAGRGLQAIQVHDEAPVPFSRVSVAFEDGKKVPGRPEMVHVGNLQTGSANAQGDALTTSSDGDVQISSIDSMASTTDFEYPTIPNTMDVMLSETSHHLVLPRAIPIENPDEPIYDAIQIIEKQTPWWKKHQQLLISLIVCVFSAATVMGILFRKEDTRSQGRMQPSFCNIYRIVYRGALYEKSCNLCFPLVGIDGNDAVVGTTDLGEVQFFSDIIEWHSVNVTALDLKSIYSVVISGDTAFVGAQYQNKNTGSGHVFQKKTAETWSHVKHIEPEGESYGFGNCVDIDGDTVVIGYEGSIRIYRNINDTWLEDARISHDGLDRLLCRSASVNGNLVAVADQRYNDGSGREGTVFVHEFDPSSKVWNLLGGPITNSDCDFQFGSTAELTADGGLLIGCPGHNEHTGAVYYYTKSDTNNRYEFQQKIVTSDGVPGDKFGYWKRLAVDENIMIATSSGNDRRIYVFVWDNHVWTEVDIIPAPSDSADFGFRVALSGRRALVSSKSNVYSFFLENC